MGGAALVVTGGSIGCRRPRGETNTNGARCSAVRCRSG